MNSRDIGPTNRGDLAMCEEKRSLWGNVMGEQANTDEGGMPIA